MNLVDIDASEDPTEDSLTPINDVKSVQIGAQISHMTQISSDLAIEGKLRSYEY